MTERVKRKVRMPDGNVHELLVPDDATDEEIQDFASEWWGKKGNADSHVAGAAKSTAGAYASTAAGGVGAIALSLALRKAFPGLRPNREFLSRLDHALHKEMGTSLKEVWPQYQQHLVDLGVGPGADQPAPSLYHFLSKDIERAPRVQRLLGEAMDAGKGSKSDTPGLRALTSDALPPNEIAQRIGEIGAGRKERIMDVLASSMKIPKDSLMESEEALKEARRINSKPLYDTAFANKTPIRNTNVLGLFKDKAMMDALKHAEELADMEGRGISQRYAANPQRRDAWKRLLTSEVPEHLFTAEENAGLRPYISPNVEELHHTREALWDLYSKNKMSDPAKAKIYQDRWRALTDAMDQYAPSAYKQARKRYAADSDVLNALETGQDIFKMDPKDVSRLTAKMSPEERAGVARGFYGTLAKQDDPKFLRNLIKNDPTSARSRQIIDSLLPDAVSRDNFYRVLNNEEILAAGERKMPPVASEAHGPELRGREYMPGSDRTGLFSFVTGFMPPYGRGAMNRRGSEILFNPMQVEPGGGISNQHVQSYLNDLMGSVYGHGISKEDLLLGGAGAGTGLGSYLFNSEE